VTNQTLEKTQGLVANSLTSGKSIKIDSFSRDITFFIALELQGFTI